MNDTNLDPFESLYDALRYVHLTSGLHINESGVLLPGSLPTWPSALSLLPLSLGFIGLIFNILALLIFTSSKTFRENSFRCYIYAFVSVNCACILTHSWFYLIFYLTDAVNFCKYLQYLQQATATTSLWIMVLLSLERSFTFSKPFLIQKLVQPRIICLILIVITTFCFATHIDELISVDIKAFRWVNFAYGICSVDRHLRFSSVRVKIITHSQSFILPFLLNSFLDIYICYKICHRPHRSTMKSSLLLPSNSNKRAHQRLKKSLAHEITLTLLCQSMWLLITYFPRHLYYFLIQFNLISGHDRDNSLLAFLMRIILLIYLAFSPALYVILSPTLRKEIRSYISLSYKRHRPASLSNMSNAQDKFQHILRHHHHYQQQRNFQPVNLTILITTSEQLPRKLFSNSITVPMKMAYISQSVPCLVLYKHEDEYDSSVRTERSNTIQE